ncbi:pentapeptide repeat-containing protein [Streptomyces sp. NPDC008343]|uniref:pentapeptide repeat-containing protein n=1 Tax=Streptomyces sp. NPDC008343 TaxID=3364828 RepID=UPI0036E0F699
MSTSAAAVSAGPLRGHHFRGACVFDGARFTREALFQRAVFDNNVRFAGARFGDTAVFGRTRFRAAADFSGARFQGIAWFGRGEEELAEDELAWEEAEAWRPVAWEEISEDDPLWPLAVLEGDYPSNGPPPPASSPSSWAHLKRTDRRTARHRPSTHRPERGGLPAGRGPRSVGGYGVLPPAHGL